MPGDGSAGASLRTSRITGGIALAAAVLTAYAPCLHGGLLWDDDGHVTSPELRSLSGLKRIWFEPGATHQYYPLLHSAFWLEHRLWGDSTYGYHLVNILLHAVSALLVVAIVQRLLGRPDETRARSAPPVAERARASSAAWLAGFLFALHPVCVESVAWISEQKNTLSGVFYLAAALVYLRFEGGRRPPDDGGTTGVDTVARRSTAIYILATLLFLCALSSKTVTATLPAALLVVIGWKRGRIEVRRDLLPLLPWLAAGAAAGLYTAWVERHVVGAEGPAFAMSLGQRCLLAGHVLWFYFAKVFWPADLTFIYPHWAPASDPFRAALPLAGALAALALLARRACLRGARGGLAGALFFAGTLFPVLGFFNLYPFRYTYVADHFQYLACLGLIVPAAIGTARAGGRGGSAPNRAVLAAAAAGLIVLAALTHRQAREYRDGEVLYRATLERNPGSWMAENNLGELLYREPGRTAEAIGHYQASLRLNPEHAEAWNNLGIAQAELGRTAEAVADYQAALRFKPDFANAHNNLANALLQLGRQPEAMVEFQTALRLEPDSAAVRNNLGNVLLQTGRLREAIRYYRDALRIDPDYVEAHNNLAAALFRTGHMREAIAEFQATLRLRPNDPNATENLRRIEAYLQSGKARGP